MNYDCEICNKCERWRECDFPCTEYSDYKLEQDLAEKNKEIELDVDKYRGKNVIKESVVMFDDINFIMDYDVSDPTYLSVVNGLIDPLKVIDSDALIEYMSECNRKYCENEGLCEVCHSELEEKDQIEEYWGSKMGIGKYLVCRNGC